MQRLNVSSPTFLEGGWIPLEYSARGENLSPQLNLDASHPLFQNYNHWVIWNLPPLPQIPEGIPHGEILPHLADAAQGIAYGRHFYKGPKPPFHWIHNYIFTVYVLDCRLMLSPKSKRSEFLQAAEGHLLQQGTLTGKFQSHRAAP